MHNGHRAPTGVPPLHDAGVAPTQGASGLPCLAHQPSLGAPCHCLSLVVLLPSLLLPSLRRCLGAAGCPLALHTGLAFASLYLNCAFVCHVLRCALSVPEVCHVLLCSLSVSCTGEAGPGRLAATTRDAGLRQPHAQWLGVTHVLHVLHVWRQVQLRHHRVLGHGRQRPLAFETAPLFLLRISLSLGFGTGQRELEGCQAAAALLPLPSCASYALGFLPKLPLPPL
jgi:hypothetical protein